MKNIKYFLIIFILLFVFIFVYKDFVLFSITNLFERILYFEKNNFTLFISSLIIINLVYFLSPIPTFPIIIFNGFVLNNLGFFLSYIVIIICSLILFKLANKIGFIFKIKYFLPLLKKINDNKNRDLNLFVMTSSRYVLPYFIHNIFFGSVLKKIKTFTLAILISEIPIIYILNKFGSHLRDLNDLNSVNASSILKAEYLITFILLFLLLLIINRASKYISKNIK
jgi:uncharacterized membrane protein YdjX (TVP38/TMEM64 family)